MITLQLTLNFIAFKCLYFFLTLTLNNDVAKDLGADLKFSLLNQEGGGGLIYIAANRDHFVWRPSVHPPATFIWSSHFRTKASHATHIHALNALVWNNIYVWNVVGCSEDIRGFSDISVICARIFRQGMHSVYPL